MLKHKLIRKPLSSLLQDYVSLPKKIETEITGLSIDSRHIKTGELFFAYPGISHDGRDFIHQACEKGAAAVLYEAKAKQTKTNKNNLKNSQIPIFAIEDLAQKIGPIAANYFNHPSQNMTVIAVTGTNGKTSCCQHLAQALEIYGYKTGVLGTLGNGTYGALEPSLHTTPSAIDMQQQLAEFKASGVEYVLIEASSHGLVQGRLNGVQIDIAIFTNLTREHLDYHGDMQTYGNAKAKLFKFANLKYAVINLDDEFGNKLINLSNKKTFKGYTFSALANTSYADIPHINVHKVHLDMHGITATIHTPWGAGVLHSSLRGRLNLTNLLAVMTTLNLLEIPFADVLNVMSDLTTVSGRMQVFGGDDNPFVIVDYAHTPDAIRQVLVSLRELTQNEIWCVFGCGGDRDAGKRPLMGQFAESLSDHVILTNDNPRTEEPHAIISDILQGMLKPERVVIEYDRSRAIRHAISCAAPNDVILIAGKGHERFQEIAGEKIDYNDMVEVQLQLKEKLL